MKLTLIVVTLILMEIKCHLCISEKRHADDTDNKLSSEVLAQKMAEETLNSPNMQETFKKLTQIRSTDHKVRSIDDKNSEPNDLQSLNNEKVSSTSHEKNIIKRHSHIRDNHKNHVKRQLNINVKENDDKSEDLSYKTDKNQLKKYNLNKRKIVESSLESEISHLFDDNKHVKKLNNLNKNNKARLTSNDYFLTKDLTNEELNLSSDSKSQANLTSRVTKQVANQILHEIINELRHIKMNRIKVHEHEA